MTDAEVTTEKAKKNKNNGATAEAAAPVAASATAEKSEARDFGEQISAMVKPLSCDIGQTQGATKAKQLGIVCEVLTGEYKGKIVKYSGLFNPENQEQWDRTVESLHTTGASLDIDPTTRRFRNFGTKNPMAVLAWEEVPATASRASYMALKVVFLNSSTGMRNTLNDDEFAAFARELKSGPGKENEINKDGTLNVGKGMKF